MPENVYEYSPGRPAEWGMPARDFWLTFCPGEGEIPSPVPSPQCDTHHDPVYGEIPEKNRLPGQLSPPFLRNRR